MRADDILACSVFTNMQAALEYIANLAALDRSDDPGDGIPGGVIDVSDDCPGYQADDPVPIGRRFRCPYRPDAARARLLRFEQRRSVWLPRRTVRDQTATHGAVLVRPLSRGEPHGGARYPRRKHLRPLGV